MRQDGRGKFAFELILVDNNSTDNTASIAKAFENVLPLKYVFEPLQGLSQARNRALREFKGDLLVFTDDDVVLEKGWLAAWAQAGLRFPNANYFGGRISPLWKSNKPRWLIDPSLPLISGLLVHYDLNLKDRYFNDDDPLPFGANFALRRNLARQLEPFREDLGVRGIQPGRGEEAEYLERARKAGHLGAYIGSAVCYHIQDMRRFSVPYLYKYGIEKGRAALLMGRVSDGSRRAQFTFAVKGLWQLIRGRGDRFRQCVINIGIQSGFMANNRAKSNKR